MTGNRFGRAALPPPGSRRVGNVVLPIDHARITREAMETAAGGAADAARKAAQALIDAVAAKTRAESAVLDAQRILAAANSAIVNGDAKLVELDGKGAKLIADADAFVQAALRLSRQTEDTYQRAVQAGELQDRKFAENIALAQGHVQTAKEIAAGLVGIQHISLREQDDQVVLIIVLTNGKILRGNVRGPRGLGSSGPAGADGKSIVNAYVNADGALIITLSDGSFVNAGVIMAAVTLTSRMLNKQPYDASYRLWFETGLSSYLYIAENLATAVATDTTFRGIRVPTDANGNPSGEVEENLGFKWSDKSGGTWA